MGETVIVNVEGVDYVFPVELSYWTSGTGHIWARKTETDLVYVGFDFFGQEQAGLITNVRVKERNTEISQGEAFGSIESSKWFGELRTPFSGIIFEINDKVQENPQLINSDPYGKGWVISIQASNIANELDNLNLIKPNSAEKLRKYIEDEIEEYIE